MPHIKKKLSTLILDKPGRQTWDINLPTIRSGEVIEIKIGNQSAINGLIRQIWKIQRMEILL